MHFKELEWPEFNKKMKQYVESQREEVIRALSGRGQFWLCTDVAHYGVPTPSWVKMSAKQRREVVSMTRLNFPTELQHKRQVWRGQTASPVCLHLKQFCVGPPPLLSAAQLNVNPFYLKKQGTFGFARVVEVVSG